MNSEGDGEKRSKADSRNPPPTLLLLANQTRGDTHPRCFFHTLEEHTTPLIQLVAPRSPYEPPNK